MSVGRRKAAAIGAAAFLAAGSAAFVMPGTAAADTVTTTCGSSVSGAVGDTLKVDASKLLLLPAGTMVVDFGTISQGTNTLSKTVAGNLLTKVCTVTVTGVQTATSPVNDLVEQATEAAKPATEPVKDAVGGLLPGGGDAPEEGGPGGGGDAPEDGGSGGTGDGTTGDKTGNRAPNSGVPGQTGGLPYNFGYAPMRDYSSIPYANAGLFTPSPALRYGTGIPGYSPNFGILGDDSSYAGGNAVQNAGSASMLPSASGGALGDVGLPGLLAVLALAGASAGLVRTWVLRKALTN